MWTRGPSKERMTDWLLLLTISFLECPGPFDHGKQCFHSHFGLGQKSFFFHSFTIREFWLFKVQPSANVPAWIPSFRFLCNERKFDSQTWQTLKENYDDASSKTFVLAPHSIQFGHGRKIRRTLILFSLSASCALTRSGWARYQPSLIIIFLPSFLLLRPKVNPST